MLEKLGGEQENILRVLTYHRVGFASMRPRPSPGLLSASPDEFHRQMSYLAENCNVISMEQLIDVRENRRMLPARSVLITFDDAYCDFKEFAWPVLSRLNLPVTLFVPTSFPGSRGMIFWWDKLYQALMETSHQGKLDSPAGEILLNTDIQRLKSFKSLRDFLKNIPHYEAMDLVDEVCAQLNGKPHSEPLVLDWDELRELAHRGVVLGAHTQTHPLLNRIPPEWAKKEIHASLIDLRREIGSVLPIFAFPSGGFDDRVINILKYEGIEVAFTTIRGINHLPSVDWLQLRRINVGRNTSLGILRAQLLPWFAHFNN
jgi:peptidoglycan/xylan/chitin deacetylase (PgdA/CDA1 family)